MKTRIGFVWILAFSVLIGQGTHGDVVVPNSAATVDADSAFFLTSTSAAGRTYQLTIHASQLTSVVGQNMTGIQFRLNAPVTADWPPVNTSYSFFDIFVGPGVAPSAMSSIFADNFSGTPVQVRSGPLTFAANAFTSGNSPNAFGPAIMFTSNYLYTGGDLTIEMRFSGQVGAVNQPQFDALGAAGGPGNGYGVHVAARWAANALATTGGNGNAIVTNIITEIVIPEPSAGIPLVLLMAGLIYRRRR